MATINASTSEKVIPVRKWLGLNQHPDGDTMLKVGEASVMKNFRITRDGNLKRRPGSELLYGMCTAYTVAVDEAEEKLFTLNATDTRHLFPIASAEVEDGTSSYTGRIELLNDAQTPSDQQLTSEEAAAVIASSSRYIWHDGLPWELSSIEQKGNRYVWTGSRVRAKRTPTGTRPVAGAWSGWVGGHEVLLCACDNYLYSLYDDVNDMFKKEQLGYLVTAKGVSFLPFDGKVYILNGYEYYCWDGTTFGEVSGYVPLIGITLQPVTTVDSESVPGAYELTGEYVNRLNGKRRVWLSPDGTNATFQLPEKDIVSVDWVKDLTTGDDLPTSGYTVNPTDGQVTFANVPDEGVNSYEVSYTAYAPGSSTDQTMRQQVTSNLFGELYAGTTDTRIFLYGDGTNRALYSGMDYDGQPRADYFPDQYEVRVGEENTPITAMIRHYSALACYKTDSAWSLTHGVIQLATDDLTPAIYSVPVNRDIGNLAPGQVRLINNNPVTLFGNHIYQWSNSSYYTSNLTRDERQARRISDRVQTFCKQLDFKDAMMWDDNDHQELYISQDGTTLVLNYAQDVWYEYDIDAVCMVNFQGELYYGTPDGWLYHLKEDAESDDGDAIDAQWVSGAMDFGADYMRKYAAMLWIGLKPEEGTSVWVTVKTDRKDTFREKLVPSTKAKVQGEPFSVKTKLKAKKFVFYRLIFESNEKAPPVTVTSADIRVRTTGYAK